MAKLLFATFSNGTAGGVAGLVPTITITQISQNSYTQQNLITAASMSAVTNASGMYFYNFTANSLTNVDYPFSVNATSSGSLDTPFQAGVWTGADLVNYNTTGNANTVLLNGSALTFTNGNLQVTALLNSTQSTITGTWSTVTNVTNPVTANNVTTAVAINANSTVATVTNPVTIGIDNSTATRNANVLSISGTGLYIDPTTKLLTTNSTDAIGTALFIGSNQVSRFQNFLYFDSDVAQIVQVNARSVINPVTANNVTTAVTVGIDNATNTRNANLVSINSSTSAASALSFASNDTSNHLKTSPQLNGITLLANVVSFLGTTITETTGLIAAAFSKFFNKATPTGTVNSFPDAVAGAANGLLVGGTSNTPLNFNVASSGSNFMIGSNQAFTVTSAAGGSGLTQQQVADAMRLSPTGTIQSGSVIQLLGTLAPGSPVNTTATVVYTRAQ